MTDHTAFPPGHFDACIAACQEALKACQACAAGDLRDAGMAMQSCVLINLDCADACAATLNALLRQSPHHGDFCALCAHLCRACAAECARHDSDHCVRCQQACERCAESCAVHATERHTS